MLVRIWEERYKRHGEDFVVSENEVAVPPFLTDKILEYQSRKGPLRLSTPCGFGYPLLRSKTTPKLVGLILLLISLFYSAS